MSTSKDKDGTTEVDDKYASTRDKPVQVLSSKKGK